MASYQDGENNFSDDDLDDLPPNTLAELENNAIQFTQIAAGATQPPRKPAPSSDYGDDFDDEDLDDAVVVDESRSVPTVLPNNIRGATVPSIQRSQYVPQGSHYRSNAGLINQQRPGASLFNPPQRTDLAQSQREVPVQWSQSTKRDRPAGGAVSLLRQIEELQQRNKALEQNLTAKTGEVAIVRSKQEKEAREHERELNAVRKLNEEKLAKQKKELEAARIAANNAATERDFFKQDLAELERVRKLNKAVERKDATTTPRKRKALPHRDGFDDDEIEIISPSKLSPSKPKSRNGTPTKPGKRKRKATDSPASVLDVHVEEIPEVTEQKLPVLDETILAKLGIQDDRFDFLGIILDHRPSKGHLRTIEALAQYSLPSSKDESLASIILGKIPTLGLKKPTDLPVQFCELLISLWAKCFEENYLKPLYLFIDVVSLALELRTLTIAPHIIDSLIPLLQTTVDKVVIPRFYRKPVGDYEEVIDVGVYLSVLHLTALGCMSEQEHIIRFWRLVRLDFILLCLSQNQPLEHFYLMLKILSTSVMRESFGNIDPSRQTLDARYIIDRLTYPLFQVPYQPTVDVRLEPHVLLSLRLACLHLLTSMTRSPFATAALAEHQTTLGRLVCLMSDTLDILYDHQAGHELSGQILTLATRLLYHLVTKHPQINIQQKLTEVPGGPQKYLLVLARLNFSEDDLVLERAIGDDIQGLALEMLESAVTPEEGDKIFEAFLSG